MDFLASLPSLARQALIFAALALVGMSITAVLKRTKLVRLDVAEGHTIVGGIMMTFAAFGAFFAIAVLVTGLWEWDNTWPQLGIWIALLAFAIAGAVVLILCASGRWRWDAVGLSYADPFTGRRTIRWAEMNETTAIWHNVWRVRGAGKRDICWSKWTIGWEKINEAVTHYRPDLAPMLEVRRARA